jgi:type IV secretory pathway protease TraF
MRLTVRIELVTIGVLLVVSWRASLWVPHVLVYAPSASLPKGWYVRAFPARPLTVGDLVVLTVPASMDAAVPQEVPQRRLLKSVAAVEGDTVCWEQGAMVRATPAGAVQYPLHPDVPVAAHPSGCQTLEAEHLVIVGTHPRSMDSRYVGPVPARLVQFRVVPLWTWEAA